MLQVGSVVTVRRGRASSNKMQLKNLKQAKVVAIQNSDNPKKGVVLEIISGSARQVHTYSYGYGSNGPALTRVGSFNMITSDYKTFVKGEVFIAFADCFTEVNSTYETKYDTTNVGMSPAFPTNINPHTLVCLLS